MFGAIGDLFGRMFGTQKAGEKVIDGVISGLDKLYYSSEEKAEDLAKEKKRAADFLLNWVNSTQGQAVTRRFLAVMISMIWIVQYAIMVLLKIGSIFAAVFYQDPIAIVGGDNMYLYQFINELSSGLGDYAMAMNGAMMLILAFYFALPQMGAIAPKALDMFSKVPFKNNK